MARLLREYTPIVFATLYLTHTHTHIVLFHDLMPERMDSLEKYFKTFYGLFRLVISLTYRFDSVTFIYNS